jgi:hypothetical protein
LDFRRWIEAPVCAGRLSTIRYILSHQVPTPVVASGVRINFTLQPGDNKIKIQCILMTGLYFDLDKDVINAIRS